MRNGTKFGELVKVPPKFGNALRISFNFSGDWPKLAKCSKSRPKFGFEAPILWNYLKIAPNLTTLQQCQPIQTKFGELVKISTKIWKSVENFIQFQRGWAKIGELLQIWIFRTNFEKSSKTGTKILASLTNDNQFPPINIQLQFESTFKTMTNFGPFQLPFQATAIGCQFWAEIGGTVKAEAIFGRLAHAKMAIGDQIGDSISRNGGVNLSRQRAH